MRTANGYEVDVLAEHPNGKRELVQICADLDSPATRTRELRALTDCLAEPQGVSWRSAVEWLLEVDPDPS